MSIKNLFGCVLIATTFVLFGCHRNYKVVHARPAVDTLSHDDVEKVSDIDVLEEPLIDIPDEPQESDFKSVNKSDRKEYDKYVKGQE